VTLICVEPSVVLLVPDRALGRIAAEQPDLWQMVAALVYLQLRGALQIAAEAVALPPRQRLASRLAMLARGAELRGEEPVLRLSQQALAEMIGLTRKTVNGYLAGFEAAGLVRLGYGVIMITDTAGLRRVAET
jgi:CRP/FNR family cyclic AMP-dependent transcriptional regulator